MKTLIAFENDDVLAIELDAQSSLLDYDEVLDRESGEYPILSPQSSDCSPPGKSPLCECGCGYPTNVIKSSCKKRVRVKGEHYKFIHGHNMYGHGIIKPLIRGIPNLCGCGCGQTTKMITRTVKKRGLFRGEYHCFINGHQNRGRCKPRFIRPSRLSCECGCGELVQWSRQRKEWRRFVNSHQNLGKERDANTRKKLSRAQKKLWEGQEYRERMLEVLSTLIRVPTKPQIKLYNIIHSIDDTFILEGEEGWHPIVVSKRPHRARKPDIVSFKHRIIVEFDGEYFHQGREFEDKFRDIQLEAKGYKVLHFGYEDLNDSKLILDEIIKLKGENDGRR